jgi:hypothetical protein
MDSSTRAMLRMSDLKGPVQAHLVSVYLVMALCAAQIASGVLAGLHFNVDHHRMATSLVSAYMLLMWINSSVTPTTESVSTTPLMRNFRSTALVSLYAFLLGFALSPALPAVAMYVLYDPHHVLHIVGTSGTVLCLMFAVAAYTTAVRQWIYAMGTTLGLSTTAAIMQLFYRGDKTFAVPTATEACLLYGFVLALCAALITTSQNIIWQAELHRDFDVFKHALLLHSRATDLMWNMCVAGATAVGLRKGHTEQLQTETISTDKDTVKVEALSDDPVDSPRSSRQKELCTNPNCLCTDCQCNGVCKCGVDTTDAICEDIIGTREHRLYDREGCS